MIPIIMGRISGKNSFIKQDRQFEIRNAILSTSLWDIPHPAAACRLVDTLRGASDFISPDNAITVLGLQV